MHEYNNIYHIKTRKMLPCPISIKRLDNVH